MAAPLASPCASRSPPLPRLTRPPPQWYPGHIARAEKQLKEQLRIVDVVVDVSGPAH